MNPNDAPLKTTWAHRLLIRLSATALGVLVYWLLGFLVSDIRSVKGPDYQAVERRHVPEATVKGLEARQEELAALQREEAKTQKSISATVQASSSLQNTVRQLIELQRFSVERQVALGEEDKANLASSLQRFLEHQEQVQSLSAEAMRLAGERHRVEEDIRLRERELEKSREPARREFQEAMQAHRLRLAAWQLALLLPLLAAAGWLVARRRESAYFVISLAVGLAILAKVVGVVHEYFPRRVFNYLLIVALIAVVARLLVRLIRQAVHPRPEALLRKYREAYERFLCPVCEHPIRSGPRRYLYWTRRTVNKALPPAGGDLKPEPYTCPHCGAGLFAPCASCGGIRHSLLPHCEHCGDSIPPARL